MALEYLAPELLSIILQSIDSPHTLHDLISASPACLRVFNQTSQQILSNLVQNTIPSINKRHILALLQAPTPATQTGVSSFLDKYFDESFSYVFPTDRAGIVNVLKLYNRVSFLINGYLNHVRKLGFGDSILTPTRSEVARLQRAFLRYGVSACVFPADDTLPWEDPSPNHDFSAQEQFDLFISRLKPWECEEIVCVEQYFSILIGNFVDEMEEQLADAVKNVLVCEAPMSKDDGKDDSRDTSGKDNLRRFDALDLTSLSIFSHDYRYRIHQNISYMASLGLEFMCDLIRSDPEERSKLLRSNSPNFRDSLEDALKFSPPSDRNEDDEESEWENDPSCNNLGWPRFGMRSQGWLYLRIDTWGYHMLPLRELGYVFWDSSRMNHMAVCDKLFAAQKMSSEKRKKRFDRRDKETLEHRFKGAMIPRSEMKRLESEFGYIKRPMEES
ncbi:uncharacterized protein FIESC28_05371 [Fusarium coffeatum]|uniref:F-box domain-containing protein n=1 Tax=Fusarium coffeatum TaxID=231269 RepID=A0A366RTG3_9HYPO|nr:uncharacterized protein FIESC28_05371 [Fusarium coffeatum]RBR20092.1 hypothetical protein FIESC28_05371 [Fusarium coffeatum]